MTSLTWNQLFMKLKPLINGVADPKKASILDLLSRYAAKDVDFEKYVSFSEQGYNKNLVERYEGANVIVMCWAAGQASLFHGHEGSRCFVKVLRGQLKEQQVPYPNKSADGSKIGQATVSYLNTNDVRYIDDSIGLHRVSNESSSEDAITLHIYSPAYEWARLFEAKDDALIMGRSSAVKVTFNNVID